MTMILTPEQRAAAAAVAEAANLLTRAMTQAAELGLVVDVSFGRAGPARKPPRPRRGDRLGRRDGEGR